MTDDALLVVESLFSTIWRFFNSWYIPGTNVTPAVAFFGILFFVVAWRVLSYYLSGMFSDISDKGGK